MKKRKTNKEILADFRKETTRISAEETKLFMPNEEKRYWQGEIGNCDICKEPMTNTFVDGPTTFGPWGNMCESCARKYWRAPMGQTYEKQKDGRWLKIQG